MRSILVIGLGRFGRNLARKLTELGNDVMVIDRDEDAINRIAPFVTKALIGDCEDGDVLSSMDVKDFDVCFVCMGEHLQSSLEIVSQLKELGAPHVVTKADSERHMKFLLALGADEVICPERDMAFRTAVRFGSKTAFDYIELSPEYAIYEIRTPDRWAGKTVRELDIRSNYNINVIGAMANGRVIPITNPDYRFSADGRIIISGNKEDAKRFTGI